MTERRDERPLVRAQRLDRRLQWVSRCVSSRRAVVDSRHDSERHTGHRVSIGERCHDESECRVTRIAYDGDRALSDERASRAKTGDQRDVSSRSVVVNAALEVALRALTNEMCGPSIAV